MLKYKIPQIVTLIHKIPQIVTLTHKIPQIVTLTQNPLTRKCGENSSKRKS